MPPYLADRQDVADAAALIARHGTAAAAREAAARAGRSRDLGNHIHFCRWRQIGRLIAWLDETPAERTVH